jgi:hypothetical protein
MFLYPHPSIEITQYWFSSITTESADGLQHLGARAAHIHKFLASMSSFKM